MQVGGWSSQLGSQLDVHRAKEEKINKTHSGHAVELRLNTLLATSNRHRVVEYGVFSIMAVCLFCGLELIVA